jgi:hypothetical protein
LQLRSRQTAHVRKQTAAEEHRQQAEEIDPDVEE